MPGFLPENGGAETVGEVGLSLTALPGALEVLSQQRQEFGHLRPGYGVLGAEEAITIAHHQPGGMGPGQGLCGIIGDQPCVLEAAEGSAGPPAFCKYAVTYR